MGARCGRLLLLLLLPPFMLQLLQVLRGGCGGGIVGACITGTGG